jgi:hypothetical protein
MPTPCMIASRRPEKTKAKSTEIKEALKGRARVSRAGFAVAPKHSFQSPTTLQRCRPRWEVHDRETQSSCRRGVPFGNKLFAHETHQKTRKFGDRLFLFVSFVCFVGPIFLWTSVSSVESAWSNLRVPLRRAVDKSSCHRGVNLFENFAHCVAEFPVWIMRLELSHVADPPDVIADAVRFLIGPG